MLDYLQRLVGSLAFRPFLGVYIGVAGVLILLSEQEIDLIQALGIMAIVILLSMIWSLHREVRTVHTLVNSQRTEMLARIDQLLDVITELGGIAPDHVDQEHRTQQVEMEKQA